MSKDKIPFEDFFKDADIDERFSAQPQEEIVKERKKRDKVFKVKQKELGKKIAEEKKIDRRCAKTLEEKKEILTQLLSLWERVPDWRLGQLIWNCYQGHDFFFITDYKFIKDIEDMLDKK